MNDSQKIAYLMGMAKFAQDNDINFDSFVKVAAANWARAGTAARNAISDVSGAVRGARNAASQGGFMAGVRDLGRRFTNTVGDALGTAGSRTRAARQATIGNVARRAAGDQTPRQSVDNVQATNRRAARRNLAVGAAGLYGLGVANNAQQAVRGTGKYNQSEIPLWNRVMMFLGLQDRPSTLGTAVSVLNPFTSGFRRYQR